jgi:enoyl-CoA hydratase/carnithine racemase
MLSGEHIPAKQAHALGIVDQVVASEDGERRAEWRTWLVLADRLIGQLTGCVTFAE